MPGIIPPRDIVRVTAFAPGMIPLRPPGGTAPGPALSPAPGAAALGAVGVSRTITSMATRKNMHIMIMLYMKMTAGVFAAVGFPALWILQERSEPTGIAWHLAWHRLFRGWRGLAHDPFARPLRRLLLCISVYQAGVAAVITLAAIYAQQVMGFDMRQTILLVLVVNVTASLGAAGFGFLQDRLGHRRSLAVSLLLWVGMVIVAARSETVEAFWLAANLAGLAMGSSQSGARAAVAALAPRGAESEAFGYWGVAVHLASVLGPLAYGVTTALSDNDHRLAILMTGLFFLVGLVLLMRVPFDLRAAQPLEAGPR
ncbi:MAG: MFS transporter [Betaproteobacteria bacterium]|nr:MFS transporter [Betaproteobacteria bacterium]